jgi:hypothetical protein
MLRLSTLKEKTLTTDSALLNTVADALDAASAVFRRAALAAGQAMPSQAPVVVTPELAVARARAAHPELGPTQATVVEHLAEYYPGWTDMGVLARRMGREQPNVHLILKALIFKGVVEKDAEASPHQYRLSPTLFPELPM